MAVSDDDDREVVHLTGTVGPHRAGTTKKGNAFVNADLTTAAGDVGCTWWSQHAPPPGSTVAVIGTDRDGGQVWVDSWSLLTGPDTPLEHRLLTYWQRCLESEDTRGLQTLPSAAHLVVHSSGPAPLLDGAALPHNPHIVKWATQRIVASGSESLVTGWPLVVGADWSGPSPVEVVAPLLYRAVRVAKSKSGFSLEPVGSVIDVNPTALGLLGLGDDDRDALVADLGAEPSEPVETVARRFLKAVRSAGIALPPTLDPHVLTPVLDQIDGIHNAALTFVSAGDLAGYNKALRRDLAALSTLPADRLRVGPLGVILGGAAPPTADSGPVPMPVVVATNAEQEQAVASAMTAPLTVVTGPPGTGKTQVLVNAVAAALLAGETVLLASKNNHAIDVVVDRLRTLHDDTAPIRTGNKANVVRAAVDVTAALGRPTVTAGDGDRARQKWADLVASAPMKEAYGLAARRAELAADLAAAEAAHADAVAKAGIPLSIKLDDDDLDLAVAALGAARRADEQAHGAKGLFAGKKRTQAEADRSEHLNAARAILGPAATDHLRRVEATAGPASAIDTAGHLIAVVTAERQRNRAREAFSVAPDDTAIVAAADQALAGRETAGIGILAGLWRDRLRAASSPARGAASAWAKAVAGGQAQRGQTHVPALLAAFPVWCTTSLATGNTFPLTPSLFDLVVIDEASQSDLASAIPLLYRGKRALVVGDPDQLPHITSVRPGRDTEIAGSAGLTESEAAPFAYSTVTLYDRAQAASGREALLLRRHFRSHPTIVELANDLTYVNQLQCRTDESRLLAGPPVRWVHVSGDWESGPGGRSVLIRAEAAAVVAEARRQWSELGPLGRSLGVVTPFRAQKDHLRELLEAHVDELAGFVGGDHEAVDTAYGFQGDERDVVIFSPVIGHDLSRFRTNFTGDRRLVNVSTTRARSRLVIVGDVEAAVASGALPLVGLAQFCLDRDLVERSG